MNTILPVNLSFNSTSHCKRLERTKVLSYETVTKIAKNVLADLQEQEHLSPLAWSWVASFPNMRILSITQSVVSLVDPVFSIYQIVYERRGMTALIHEITKLAFYIFILSNLTGFTTGLAAYYLMNGFTMLMKFSHSYHTLCHAQDRFKRGLQTGDPCLRVSLMISGLILSLFGLLGMNSSVQGIEQLRKGYIIAQSLDSTQQQGVLKHNSLHTLGHEKNCTAAIIDGVSPKWGKFADEIPFPTNELIAKTCETRFYRIDSDEQFTAAIYDAADYFKRPIDVISLSGHANNNILKLGPNYYWMSSSDPSILSAMKQNLTANGQVLVLGCNTATVTFQTPDPLALRVSKHVPGRFVTGIAAYLNPSLTTNWYSNRFFHVQNYLPVKLSDAETSTVTHFANSITYRDGEPTFMTTSSFAWVTQAFKKMFF